MEPWEFNAAIEAYNKKKNDDAQEYACKFEAQQKALIMQAYLTSRWVWTKRVDIKKYMESKKKEPMTDEQMLAQAKALTRFFGGEVQLKDGED